jgi:hypothetical protein
MHLIKHDGNLFNQTVYCTIILQGAIFSDIQKPDIVIVLWWMLNLLQVRPRAGNKCTRRTQYAKSEIIIMKHLRNCTGYWLEAIKEKIILKNKKICFPRS